MTDFTLSQWKKYFEENKLNELTELVAPFTLEELSLLEFVKKHTPKEQK